RFPFELEYRCARHHAQALNVSERADQFFSEAIAEVLVLGIGTQVHEGKDRDRGLLGLGEARLGSRAVMHHRRITALGILNYNGVAGPLLSVIVVDPRAQVYRLHTY